MKTDFSDWLIVSDVDGTLNTKLRMLPERNLKAITHFVEDLGGNFTLASGRNISSLRKHYERLPIKSTPAVVLNGAGIYDYEHEKMLSFHSIDERGIDIVRRVNERFPLIQIEICTDRDIYSESRSFQRRDVAGGRNTAPELQKIRRCPEEQLGQGHIYGSSADGFADG